eukprot:scaffold42116_cov241-Skeletonema_marinoi.AAC.1
MSSERSSLTKADVDRANLLEAELMGFDQGNITEPAREYNSQSSNTMQENGVDLQKVFAGNVRKVMQDTVKRKGDKEILNRVLKEIEMISAKRMSEGLNQWNFSFGVFNCFFIVYIFGAHPEHLWLVYLVEGMYMIPRKFYNMWHAKPLNQALYYLDFCWSMNFTAFALILLLVFSGVVAHDEGLVSDVARKSFFNAMMGVACGTLMGANIVLPFVACMFHDVNTMTGLFIHLMPPMVMYTFMWHSAEIKEHWPYIFHLTYLEGLKYFPEEGIFFTPGDGLDSVAGSSVALYFLWWIPYVCFQLLIGIDLPKKIKDDGTPAKPVWDTVFHSTMRQGLCITLGKVFRGRSKKDSIALCMENDFDLIDFFIYMICHLIAAMAAFYLIGYPCFVSQEFHLFMIIFVTWLVVARGAKRYTYYTTKMYARVLRQHFADHFS